MITLRKIGLAGAVLTLISGSASAEDRRTDIHHTDGTTSTVTTDRHGTQVVTPGHGGGQFGQGIPHNEVVKQYTRPGSQVERR
jgi:hypothetical protein